MLFGQTNWNILISNKKRSLMDAVCESLPWRNSSQLFHVEMLIPVHGIQNKNMALNLPLQSSEIEASITDPGTSRIDMGNISIDLKAFLHQHENKETKKKHTTSSSFV